MPAAKPKPAPNAATPTDPELVLMPLKDMLVNPRNPRVHPVEQITRLEESLRRHGQTRPLLLRRHNRMLIAGHGVREAMLRQGWKEARAILLDVSQEAADRMMLADNRTSDLSKPHDQMVQQLLAEFGKDDWLSVGYSEAEALKMLEPLEAQVRRAKATEVPTSLVGDTFWISIRGPLAQQADVLLAIEGAVGGMPGVSVELGNIRDRTR